MPDNRTWTRAGAACGGAPGWRGESAHGPGMSEDSGTTPKDPNAPEGAKDAASADAKAKKPRLRDVWQVPVLAVASAALLWGVVHAFQTKPKADLSGRFTQVEQLMEAAQYREALAVLNDAIRPHMSGDALTPDQRREFHVLRGRALARGQAEEGLDVEQNHRAIIREYLDAEGMHATLEEEDVTWLARSYTALHELPEAMERISEVHDDAERVELLKAVVESARQPAHRNDGLALEVLSELAQDLSLSRDDRLWVLTRQTELLMAEGFNDEAILKVLRSMPRLEGAPPESVGELLVLVAGAYMNQQNVDEARRYLGLAEDMLAPESETMSKVHLMRGLVEQQAGVDLGIALEQFDAVLTQFGFSSEAMPALLGAAETEAQIALAQDSVPEGAIARYTRLVDQMLNGAEDVRVSVDRVAGSLLDRAREQFDRGDAPSSLALATQAERLYSEEDTPDDVLLAIAKSQRAIADKMLATLASDGILSLAHADPVTQREARDRLVVAGAYFRRYASAVASTDANGYADSLWNASDSFDRAGDVEGAVAGFRQFIGDLPTDNRSAEARFRLAQSYQARGDLSLAAQMYEELIASRVDGHASGPYADASYVPLAQALLADDDTSNDGRAEQLLQRVLAGALGGPDTRVYREALLALGQHYYSTADVPGHAELAMEHLTQFLDRAEADPKAFEERDIDSAIYGLADSCRVSAQGIAKTLGEAMPEGLRMERDKARRERLTKAGELFAQVRDRLEHREHATALDELRLRNAYFYIGDMAFDMGKYEESIRMYDAARERYAREPASLVALTQIVAAYLALGDMDRARATNARAVAFHASLPDSVWDDPTLPMTREAWARWLDSQAKLGTFGAAETQ